MNMLWSSMKVALLITESFGEGWQRSSNNPQRLKLRRHVTLWPYEQCERVLIIQRCTWPWKHSIYLYLLAYWAHVPSGPVILAKGCSNVCQFILHSSGWKCSDFVPSYLLLIWGSVTHGVCAHVRKWHSKTGWFRHLSLLCSVISLSNLDKCQTMSQRWALTKLLQIPTAPLMCSLSPSLFQNSENISNCQKYIFFPSLMGNFQTCQSIHLSTKTDANVRTDAFLNHVLRSKMDI